MSNRDGFEVDLSTYKDRQSARLEPGKYLVRITDAETGTTKGGDPKVTLFYNVVGGPAAGSPLIDTLTLTDKAMFRLVKVMRAIGMTVDKKKQVLPFRAFVGKTMYVTVADGEEYNDVIKSEVRDYAPSGNVASMGESKPVPVAVEVEPEIEDMGYEYEPEFRADDDGMVNIPEDISL